MIRNNQGAFIRAATTYIGRTNNNSVELIAIKTGLILALHLNVNKLIVQSDSNYVLHCIDRPHETLWYHKSLVTDIIALMEKGMEVCFTFVYR